MKAIKKCCLIMLLMSFNFFVCSCNLKKPRVKPTAYEGSIMLYSSLTEEESQMIKENFESACPGITLDYYYGTDEEVENKIVNEKNSNAITADIVLIKDLRWLQHSKNMLYVYEPYDARKIDKKYKDIDNSYVPVAILSESNEKNPSFIYAAVIKGSISEINATYLVDYLLSKEGQTLFKNMGYLSVNSKN